MKRVMFVCRKNSARSQMAEGFAKKLGEGKIAVASSGLVASAVRPDALADFNSEDFEAVISLCGCGVSLPEAWLTRAYFFDDWELEDPAERPEIFPEIRDEIEKRVVDLLGKIENET